MSSSTYNHQPTAHSSTATPTPASTTNATNYEHNYSSNINHQMQVPSTIRMSSQNNMYNHHSLAPMQQQQQMMEVPDRIVLSVDNRDTHLAHGDGPLEPLNGDVIMQQQQQQQQQQQVPSISAPPRVLTVESVSIADGQMINEKNVDRALKVFDDIDDSDEDENTMVDNLATLARKIQLCEEELESLRHKSLVFYGISLAFVILSGFIILRR